MKRVFLIIILLSYSITYSQNNTTTQKPKLLLGVSSVLSSSSNMIGMSYNSTYTVNGVYKSKTESILNFNLSPKLGFYLSDKSVLGCDILIANSKNEDTHLSLFGIGPFYRYYPNAFNKTFFEVNTSLGRVNENQNYLLSNNKLTNKYNSIGFSVGTGMIVSNRFSLELSVNYKHENLIYDSNSKEVNNSFGMTLGFIGFL